MIQQGSRVKFIENGGKEIYGTVVKRSSYRGMSSDWYAGSASGNYWTIVRDDGVYANGDDVVQGWVMPQEELTLIGGGLEVPEFFD